MLALLRLIMDGYGDVRVRSIQMYVESGVFLSVREGQYGVIEEVK